MRMRITTATFLTALGSSCIGLAGCATDDDYWETADFGDSVRHTITLQTASPDSAGTGLEGQKALAVLKAYRQEVSVTKDVGFTDTAKVRPVEFQIGN